MQNRGSLWAQMTVEERAEFTAGQVDALFAFVGAAMRTHPNRDELALDTLANTALQVSANLNSPASEMYLDGQREGRMRLASLFRASGANLPRDWEMAVK